MRPSDEFGLSVSTGWALIASAGGVELWGEVKVDPAMVVEFLHDSARACLPLGSRYEIRKGFATNYGRTNHRAWYNNPGMLLVEPWEWEGERRHEDGYVLLGRYVTRRKDPG